jgi:hypothetical protein
MSAFKFITKRSVDLVTDRDPPGTQRVDIYKKTGQLWPVRWIGFCRQEQVPSRIDRNWRYVKMAAISVSRDTGAMSDRWRILLPSEYVVCLMVPYNASEPGVYTIIDDRGWPVVKSSRGVHR